MKICKCVDCNRVYFLREIDNNIRRDTCGCYSKVRHFGRNFYQIKEIAEKVSR